MNLNEEQKIFLLEKLALKDEYHKIKRDFENFFETKIQGEEIIRFKAENKALIEKISIKQLSDIHQEPLAHSRIRLRRLHEAIEEASTPRAVRSIPLRASGKDIEYEVIYEKDLSLVNQLVKTAQAEEFFYKKLILSAKLANISTEDELELTKSAYKVFDVDNGIKAIESDAKETSS